MQLKRNTFSTCLKAIVLLFCIYTLSINCIHANIHSQIDSIKKKYTDIIIREHEGNGNIRELINRQKKDGSWPEINYNDQSEAGFDGKFHLDYLKELAIFHKNNPESRLSKELGRSIHSGIQYWINTAPRAEGWWWDQIGTPLILGEVCLLFEENLEHELLEGALQLMYGINGDKLYYLHVRPEKHTPATGQNLIWFAKVHLIASLLQQDTAGIKTAFKKVGKEIRISEEEGVQHDFSFHQHGPQLYSGSYGMTFTLDASLFLYLASGTSFAYPGVKEDILVSYLLDGQKWMVYKERYSYNAKGRAVTRENPENIKPLINTCEFLANLNHIRSDEIDSFHGELAFQKKSDSYLGNKYFWQSDFMAHQMKDYYVSLRMASNRTIGSESGNNENLKGYYMGHGVYFIKRRGDEYKGIFPVWNWKQLPGHIAQQDTVTLPYINWGRNARGEKSFVGGVSDGEIGFTTYDYHRNNLSAKRSWFFFENSMVHLASGISCPDNVPVRQTINQCLLQGDVWYSTGKEPGKLSSPDKSFSGIRSVWHDSITYVFPGETNIDISAKSVTANWHEINHQYDSLITQKVFNLGIPLGESPQEASLAYAVLPNTSLNDFSKNTQFPVKIIENNSKLQAVWNDKDKVLQVSFYKPAIIKIPGTKYEAEMERAGMLMVKFENQQVKFSFCNPEHEFSSNKINLYEDGLLLKSFSIPLFAPPYAGKTVIRIFELEKNK